MLPSTTELIARLVEAAADRSPRLRRVIPVIPGLGTVGFEMVLNDLWQICQPAVPAFLDHLREFDAAATPSLAHAFLGQWLDAGHSVITTNYDRLIERTWEGRTRFDRDAADDTGFAEWERDVQRGALFKIHGSLQRTSSCLAALEHVGTTTTGRRRDLLLHVFSRHPMCFVGWRGVDPDVPPVLRATLADRPRDLPLFWVHHTAGSKRGVSPLLREVASIRPIVGSADEILGRLDVDGAAARRLADAVAAHPPAKRPQVRVDLASACSVSGVSRFAGISLRRAGHERLALRAFDVAAIEAQQVPEWASAREERALTLWANARGGDRGEMAARNVVGHVYSTLRRRPGVAHAETQGPLFGYLSMTVSLAGRHPSLVARLPRLFRIQRAALADARAVGADPVGVDIQAMLTDLYEGRLRLLLAGRLALRSARLKRWILVPYRRARSRASSLPERSLHARFDVLAGYAVALARLGDCRSCLAELDELDRLSLLLSDPRRLAHWDEQRATIARFCPPEAG